MIVFDYSAAWKTFWIVIVLVWSLPWKGVALWKSARRKEIGWFILILVVQTMAILEIIYLFWIVRENKNHYKKAKRWWKKKKR
jgi:hypothetical protein